MLALGQETAVQAIVGSIVRAFRRLKKPTSREISARGYALYSVCPNFLFPSIHTLKSSSGHQSSHLEAMITEDGRMGIKCEAWDREYLPRMVPAMISTVAGEADW